MVNSSFWQNPPWQGGVAKHRLGLRPVEASEWLARAPVGPVLANKRRQLQERYADVVGVMAGADTAQSLLLGLPLPVAVPAEYPDPIADAAMGVADDLCLLDVEDEQRLIAGCVCAPSYWRLSDKLGLPLREVHAPVDGMNKKIGANIARFIERMPVERPFARANWFLHGDARLFHPAPEAELTLPVAQWIVRSERQTLCKLSSRYLLFTIEIVCEPLADMAGFTTAHRDLVAALQRMDEHEISHFGGADKHRRLLDHVCSDTL